MRSTQTLLLLITFLLFPLGVQAVESDASDDYLEAYQMMQSAEKLEKDGRHQEAHQKYANASELFDEIARKYPSWNPQMVNFRRKKIRELARASKDMAAAMPAMPEGPASPLFPGVEKASPPKVAVQPSRSTPASASSLPVGSLDDIARQVQRQLDEKKQQIDALEAEKVKMTETLSDRDSLLKLTQQQLIDAKKLQDDLTKRIAAKEVEYEKALQEGRAEADGMKLEVAELRNELKKAATGMKEANDQSKKILDELEKANTTIAQLTTERDEIEAERDDTAKLMKSTLAKKGGFEALMTENERLRSELKTAQTAVAKLTREKGESDEKVSALQAKVAEITAEVVQLRKENAEYKKQVGQLRDQLVATQEELVLNAPPATDTVATQENEQLRGFILSQLRQHTVAQQKKAMVLAELERLEVNSKSLLFSIDELAKMRDFSSEEKEFLAAHGFDDIITESAAPVSAPVDVVEESEESILENLFKAASYEFSQKNYKAAEAGYQGILNRDSEHAASLYNLGVVKLRMGNFGASRDLFHRVLALKPDHPLVPYMLGVCYFQDQQYDEATKAFEQALITKPKNSKAHHYLGVVALSSGEVVAAEEHFHQALSIDPELADSHFNLAVLYGSTEPANAVRARKHYAEALKLGIPRDEGLEELIGPMDVKSDSAVSAISE